jgi:large subunit ribosomal protein L3
MGSERVTIRGLKVVEVLSDKNVILVSGAIPGPKNGLVVVSNRKAEYDAGKIAVKQ